MQHHAAKLNPEATQPLVQDCIEILDTPKSKRISKWEDIILTILEIENFCGAMTDFLGKLDKHILVRIKARYYSYDPSAQQNE